MNLPTPREAAQEELGCVGVYPNECSVHRGSGWPCEPLRTLTIGIAERDEQVRADERARMGSHEMLVDLVRCGVLEEKREDRLRPVWVPCDCEHPTHARLVGDDSPLTHAAFETVPVVQYATPWQPDTRTDEQRSDDAITTLRRRLTEEPTDG